MTTGLVLTLPAIYSDVIGAACGLGQQGQGMDRTVKRVLVLIAFPFCNNYSYK